MRKVLSNIKGFAMAELLAVSIAVLLIFSILFSNYLPLVVEYENRLSYNDVTAQYAAHYVRKMYKDALEDQTKGPGLKTTLEAGINSPNKFRTVYKKNTVTEMCNHVLASDKEKCNDIIREYGIEEVIITNYQLTGVGYTKSSGKLTNYISYLPEYKKSIYTGADVDENKQLYRIILKTADFGYATTPILSDYVVPATCFEMNYSNKQFTITGYKGITTECPANVFIPSGRVADSNGRKGTIIAIGNEAFKDMPITSIEFGEDIVSIGDSAFEGTKISTVDLKQVTSIGKRAFANTQLTEVSLLPGRTYEDEVFADNGKLTTVDLSSLTDDIKKSDGNLAKSMFANSGNNSSSGINVNIPKDMKNIGEKMFYLAYINKIEFAENSSLQTIGKSAFEQNSTNTKTLSAPINIPVSVKTIEENSFRYLGITGLSFVSNGSLETIGTSAFAQSPNNGVTLTAGNIQIPASVTTIGASGFQNLGITGLSFAGKNITTIGKYAFRQEKNTTNAKITNLFIPASVTTLSEGSFENLIINGNLEFEEGINLNNGTIIGNTFDCEAETRSSCGEIEKVVIPTGVVTIGTESFRNRGIKILELNNSNLSTIGIRAFSKNKIKNLDIPNSVEIIGASAFESNEELETIKLSENPNMTKIQSSTFNNCSNSITSSKNIIIPDNIKVIQNTAFNNANIGSVTFSDNSKLEMIGMQAFQNNTYLEKFTVPSTVTSIGNFAFNGCSNFAEQEGNFINKSSYLIDTNWCDIFYYTNDGLSCNVTTSGNTTILTPVGLSETKYITNAGGSN